MILVDTGPLVAAADADDARHEVCAEALERAQPPLLVSGPVIAEVCYMLVRRAALALRRPSCGRLLTGPSRLSSSSPETCFGLQISSSSTPTCR